MKRAISIFFCLIFSTIIVGQTISKGTRELKRKKAIHYSLSKEKFTSIHKRQNTYSLLGERFKLYRRKIITDVTLHQFSGKPNDIQNVAEIIPYNFDLLQHKKFIAYRGNYKYELYQFNQEFFILEQFHAVMTDNGKKEWKFHLLEMLPFTFIKLKGKRRILSLISLTHQNYIVPKKNKVTLKIWARYQGHKMILLNFIKPQSYRATYDSKKLQLISSHLFQLNKYYHIVSKKRKKRLYNYRGEDVLRKSYDSIVLGSFIIGYKRNEIDAYNQAFQKFDLPNLQAVHLDRSNLYNLQVIQNNELKRIPLSSNTSEKYILSNPTPPYMPKLTLEMMLKIEERTDKFAFIHEFSFDTLTISKSDIKDIYFLENRKKEIITNHYSYIITELNNEKYNLLDIRNPKSSLLLSMDEIKQVGTYVRFKKNNLYGYFGINTKVRYKKLDQFQGFFAKFELPNGKKGWLDRNGKEYVNL